MPSGTVDGAADWLACVGKNPGWGATLSPALTASADGAGTASGSARGSGSRSREQPHDTRLQPNGIEAARYQGDRVVTRCHLALATLFV